MADPKPTFSARGTSAEIEAGAAFMPKFDAAGLAPAIVQDTATGEVLMFAWMNADALRLTIETRIAHFWTRSRNRIWKKGEESGNLLRVDALHVDCDQDVLLVRVTVAGGGVACHTGARSCFYRRIDLDAPPALKRT